MQEELHRQRLCGESDWRRRGPAEPLMEHGSTAVDVGVTSSFHPVLSSVLPDVELLAVDSTKASCWVNNKLRAHEEQWKEDDCTFCQCVDSEPHCTAMACKQSCQNPVKIPGECCPFCEGTFLFFVSSAFGSIACLTESMWT